MQNHFTEPPICKLQMHSLNSANLAYLWCSLAANFSCTCVCKISGEALVHSSKHLMGTIESQKICRKWPLSKPRRIIDPVSIANISNSWKSTLHTWSKSALKMKEQLSTTVMTSSIFMLVKCRLMINLSRSQISLDYWFKVTPEVTKWYLLGLDIYYIDRLNRWHRKDDSICILTSNETF